ncbi:MAG: hypothetical protein RLZZ306_2817 [Bacteroidota bacterium]
MKRIKNQILVITTMLFTGLGIMNCQKSAIDVVEPTGNNKTETNPSEYAKLMNARTSFKGYKFNIVEIKRTDNLLKVTVEGDCDTEAYKVIWDGVINFTEPTDPNMVLGSTNLIISHESTKGYSCKAIIRHTIDIDLKKLLGNAYTPSINILISNASKVDDKIVDPKGVVTIKK